MDVEVRVGGQGTVLGDASTSAAEIEARCDVCDASCEAVASMAASGAGAPWACPDCLRGRLEAISVARWRFRSSSGLPWGKLTS